MEDRGAGDRAPGGDECHRGCECSGRGLGEAHENLRVGSVTCCIVGAGPRSEKARAVICPRLWTGLTFMRLAPDTHAGQRVRRRLSAAAGPSSTSTRAPPRSLRPSVTRAARVTRDPPRDLEPAPAPARLGDGPMRESRSRVLDDERRAAACVAARVVTRAAPPGGRVPQARCRRARRRVVAGRGGARRPAARRDAAAARAGVAARARAPPRTRSRSRTTSLRSTPRALGDRRSRRVSAMTIVTADFEVVHRRHDALRLGLVAAAARRRAASAVSGVRRLCDRSAACSRSARRRSPIRTASMSSARLTSTTSAEPRTCERASRSPSREPARDVGERVHRLRHRSRHAIRDEPGEQQRARPRDRRATATPPSHRAGARCAGRSTRTTAVCPGRLEHREEHVDAARPSIG